MIPKLSILKSLAVQLVECVHLPKMRRGAKQWTVQVDTYARLCQEWHSHCTILAFLSKLFDMAFFKFHQNLSFLSWDINQTNSHFGEASPLMGPPQVTEAIGALPPGWWLDASLALREAKRDHRREAAQSQSLGWQTTSDSVGLLALATRPTPVSCQVAIWHPFAPLKTLGL